MEGRYIPTQVVCLLVCFSFFGSVASAAAVQILENVYQPFWFEGGMACSHLGVRKL